MHSHVRTNVKPVLVLALFQSPSHRGLHSHYTKMYLSTTCVVVREFQFPGAIQIVDIFHARQHLWDVARKLYPGQEAEQKRWMDIHQNKLLDEGKIEELVTALRAIDSLNPELLEKIRSEADYFDNNMQRMRYPTYREQHLFIGSGVIEAGCKTIIGSRCKQSGMFWTVRGANAILALRCCHFNGRFEDYWEARSAA